MAEWPGPRVRGAHCMNACVIGVISVPYRFFVIPVRNHGVAEEELNRFLRSHRVLSVDRRWVDQGSESFWSFCADYLETGQDGSALLRGSGERGKVDYREVLKPEEFALFVKLRTLRQEIAKDEAVPVYMIFTNEQLAQMVRLRARTKTDLDNIAGVGEARIQKYGERFLACAKQHRDGTHETRGAADGAGPRAGEHAASVLAGGPGKADQA
jgi:superfamily II DNA helicase RecQ